MDTNDLSRLAQMIADLANSNLKQLQGKCSRGDRYTRLLFRHFNKDKLFYC